MSLRGRGALEVKPSLNPFMQSGSSMYGYKPTAARSWKHPEPEPPARVAINTNDGNFAFLYTRESDRIGSEVAKPTNSIQHEEKSKAMLLREKRDKLRETQSRMPPPLTEHEVTSMKAAETTRALNSFKHNQPHRTLGTQPKPMHSASSRPLERPLSLNEPSGLRHSLIVSIM